MSHLAFAEIVIPIVAGAALAVWIAMVIYADRRPRNDGGDAPRRDAATADSVRGEVGQAPASGDAPPGETAGGEEEVTEGTARHRR